MSIAMLPQRKFSVRFSPNHFMLLKKLKRRPVGILNYPIYQQHTYMIIMTIINNSNFKAHHDWERQ